MSLFRVALLQMASCSGAEGNDEKGESFCRRAAAMGADLALFPEMWSIGYEAAPGDPNARAAWQARAKARDDPFLRRHAGLARELRMAIAVTYLERWDGQPRNTVTVFDRHGEAVLTYAKVHLCEFDMESAMTPGDAFPVAGLDTVGGPVRIGAMICYDREFPETARILMLGGAEVILTPNACTLDEHRVAQFRARAFENMVSVAMTNYAAPQHNGRSMAFDAVCYGPDERPLDPLVVEAGPEEGVWIAEFDIDRLRGYRRQETWGNAFRRPRLYGALTGSEVREPFRRPEARR